MLVFVDEGETVKVGLGWVGLEVGLGAGVEGEQAPARRMTSAATSRVLVGTRR